MQHIFLKGEHFYNEILFKRDNKNKKATLITSLNYPKIKFMCMCFLRFLLNLSYPEVGRP